MSAGAKQDEDLGAVPGGPQGPAGVAARRWEGQVQAAVEIHADADDSENHPEDRGSHFILLIAYCIIYFIGWDIKGTMRYFSASSAFFFFKAVFFLK